MAVGIASNAVLSSVLRLEGLENVMILGYKNDTVCRTITICLCNNVAIKGINWKKCGYTNKSTYPGVYLSRTEFLQLILSFHSHLLLPSLNWISCCIVKCFRRCVHH